jgi:endonuclease/exonuclease/phosphatase family metal-dependent hydrolase
MAGDFNYEPAKDNIHSDMFIDCPPASFQIGPKSLDFTYTHSSGHASNIDHVLSFRSIPCLPVTVYTDDPISDHLGLSFHLQPSQNINIQKTRRWAQKKNWNKYDAIYV